MANGKKGKVKFVQGPQSGGGTVVVVPTTQRLAVRGLGMKPHRNEKFRGR